MMAKFTDTLPTVMVAACQPVASVFSPTPSSTQ
jgi:hypothetical protein